MRPIPANHPFWSNVCVGSAYACWGWLGSLDQHGYGYQGRERAHRIAWEVYHRKSLKKGDVVRHTCDNPSCCNPEHLRLGSQKDNISDRVVRERSARGAANGRAVLSNLDALSIFHAPGRQEDIAKQYGVSIHTVVDIKNGRTWSWLTGKSYSRGWNFRAVDASSDGAKT